MYSLTSDIDRNETRPELGGSELLAELLHAAQLGMDGHVGEVRLRHTGHRNELQALLSAGLAQAVGEFIDSRAPRRRRQAVPAGAIDAEEVVNDRPADDVLQALLRHRHLRSMSRQPFGALGNDPQA
jgi:hypothetical protein